MKRAVVLLITVCAIAVLGGANVWASCSGITPIGHALDSFFLCNDSGTAPVQAFIYEIGAAGTDNSADITVACRGVGANDPGTHIDCIGLGAGTIGDGQVSIQTDAFISSWLGCPAPSGVVPKRIVAVVTDATGKGLLLSVSGNDPGLAYQFEAAQPFDDVAGTVGPVACGNSGRPKVTSFVNNGASLSIGVHQDLPPVYSDCDAGTLGKFLQDFAGGASCLDSFDKTFTRGAFYTRLANCLTTGAPSNIGLANWQRSPASPDGLGNAVINTPVPTVGQCVFIAGSGTFPPGGQTAEFLTGYVQIPAPGAASPRAEEVRVARGQGKIDVSWVSRSEINLAAYKVLVDKKGALSEALTVAPQGNGGASSYKVSVDMKAAQGGKSIIVRAVLTDGTTVDAAPVSF